MRTRLFLQGINLIVSLLTVAVATLKAVLPRMGGMVGETSEGIVLFLPRGYAFLAWSVVYALLCVFAFYQVLPRNREKAFLDDIGVLYLVSSSANIVWILLWLYGQTTLSLMPMLAVMVMSVTIYNRLNVGRPGSPLEEKLLVHAPFSVYLGWMTFTSIGNLVATFNEITWEGIGYGEFFWAALPIVLALIFAGRRFRGHAVYAITVIVILSGIFMQIEYSRIVLSATIGATFVAAGLIARTTLSRMVTASSPRLGRKKLAQYRKLLSKEELMLIMDSRQIVEYWKKVKETIHLFDEIIAKYVVQWAAILLAIISGSMLAFYSSTPQMDLSPLAIVVALSTTLISIPIAAKCWFYYQLLEEALTVAEDIEEIMFANNEVRNLAQDLGLTKRLTKISTKPILGVRLFGWTILLPFLLLFGLSISLILLYLSQYLNVVPRVILMQWVLQT